jgi:hypothetical protein
MSKSEIKNWKELEVGDIFIYDVSKHEANHSFLPLPAKMNDSSLSLMSFIKDDDDDDESIFVNGGRYLYFNDDDKVIVISHYSQHIESIEQLNKNAEQVLTFKSIKSITVALDPEIMRKAAKAKSPVSMKIIKSSGTFIIELNYLTKKKQVTKAYEIHEPKILLL